MTSIVIVGLGAVVVLILVVVLAAMHYLKADSEDPFDELPDERLGAAANHDRRSGFRRPQRDAHPAQRGPGGEQRRSGRERDGGRGYGDRPERREPRERSRGYADDHEYAGGRGGQRAAADRRGPEGPAKRQQESLPALRPHQSRDRRGDGNGEWPSTKWDELSDVDYWAEVASDKPLTTTAQPAGQARHQNRTADRPAQGGRPTPPPQRELTPPLPVRGQRQPGTGPQPAVRKPEFAPAPVAAVRAPADAAQWSSGAPSGPRPDARPGSPGQPHPRSDSRPDARRPDTWGGAWQAEPSLAGLGSRPQPVADDDDPLTSPSFPRIPAADSRSYRNGRDRSPATGPHGRAAYGQQPQRSADYVPAAAQAQSGGYGTAGQQDAPGGYGRPAAAAISPQPYHAATPAASPAAASYRGAADYQAASPAGPGYLGGQLPAVESGPSGPVALTSASGNPYGSYVSSPPRSATPGPAAEPPAALPVRYDAYQAGLDSQRDALYQQPASGAQVPAPSSPGVGNGWYPAGAAGHPGGYPDVAAQPVGLGGNEVGYHNGRSHAAGPDYPNGSEPVGYLPAGYPAPAGQIDPAGAGYAAQDPYGRDPYAGYPGYGTDR